MHHFHDGGVRAVHYTGHMLHEKTFWAILGILALVAGLFTLIVLYGGDVTMQHYSVPVPYGPYY
jgi:hypothetical protein